MTNQELKLFIFSLVVNSSRTIIETYLHKLSVDIDTPYNDVVDEFNFYSEYRWNIEQA